MSLTLFKSKSRRKAKHENLKTMIYVTNYTLYTICKNDFRNEQPYFIRNEKLYIYTRTVSKRPSYQSHKKIKNQDRRLVGCSILFHNITRFFFIRNIYATCFGIKVNYNSWTRLKPLTKIHTLPGLKSAMKKVNFFSCYAGEFNTSNCSWRYLWTFICNLWTCVISMLLVMREWKIKHISNSISINTLNR